MQQSCTRCGRAVALAALRADFQHFVIPDLIRDPASSAQVETMQLRDLVERASGALLIEFILATIHTYTIMARDPDLAKDDRAMINNRIHYLTGHALSLSRGEELDAWRIDGITEHFGPLAPSLQKHPLEVLKKQDIGSSSERRSY